MAHILNGLLLLFIVVSLAFAKIQGPFNRVVVLLLFSIAIGIHGLSHLGLEKEYNYNPFNPVNRLLS